MAIQRLTETPFPPYRFVPGQNPHPRRHPQGHSFAIPEPNAASLDIHGWRESQDYLYGLDLFNAGYWWESHEAFEALWNATGHDTPVGRFLQGLVFAAAAQLKRHAGAGGRGQTLFAKALARLVEFPPRYLGVDVATLRQELEARLADNTKEPVCLRVDVA